LIYKYFIFIYYTESQSQSYISSYKMSRKWKDNYNKKNRFSSSNSFKYKEESFPDLNSIGKKNMSKEINTEEVNKLTYKNVSAWVNETKDKEENKLPHGWIEINRNNRNNFRNKTKNKNIDSLKSDSDSDNGDGLFMGKIENMNDKEYNEYAHSIMNKIVNNHETYRNDYIDTYGYEDYIYNFTSPNHDPLPSEPDNDSSSDDYQSEEGYES